MPSPILSVIGQPASKTTLPLAADKSFVRGILVAVNSSGYLVPVTADVTLTVAGIYWGDSLDTTGTSDGDETADVLQCVAQMYNGADTNAITNAMGQPCYTNNGYTAQATSNTGTWPVAGQVIGFDQNTQVSGAVNVQVGLAANSLIKLVEDLTGMTLPLAVQYGGTGASSLTNHGLLVGGGTGAVDALAVGTNGQLVVGQTGADPSFVTITGDVSITAAGVTTVSGLTSLDTRVSSETSARTSAVTSLDTRVSSETSARTSAVTSLDTRVSSETSARTSAVTSLDTRVSSETSARTSAVTSLDTRVSTTNSTQVLISSTLSSYIAAHP